jgi:hypothetical protein
MCAFGVKIQKVSEVYNKLLQSINISHLMRDLWLITPQYDKILDHSYESTL